jgi:hypothetical protein
MDTKKVLEAIQKELGILRKEKACSEHCAARDYNRGYRDGLRVARNIIIELKGGL